MQHIATPGRVSARSIPPRRRSTRRSTTSCATGSHSAARRRKRREGHDEAAAPTATSTQAGLLANLNVPITTDELHEAMRRLRNNTRGRHGEWTYELLKHGGQAMHKLLVDLAQLFFALERVPKELRLGDIVIAFKDADRRQPLDNRPR
jgi:hypothetical protein